MARCGCTSFSLVASREHATTYLSAPSTGHSGGFQCRTVANTAAKNTRVAVFWWPRAHSLVGIHLGGELLGSGAQVCWLGRGSTPAYTHLASYQARGFRPGASRAHEQQSRTLSSAGEALWLPRRCWDGTPQRRVPVGVREITLRSSISQTSAMKPQAHPGIGSQKNRGGDDAYTRFRT